MKSDKSNNSGSSGGTKFAPYTITLNTFDSTVNKDYLYIYNDNDGPAIREAGASTSGNWNFNGNYGDIWMKAFCTHISAATDKTVWDHAGENSVFIRVIAVDDYHIVLSCIGTGTDESGTTWTSAQTCSNIIRIKLSNYGKLRLTKKSSNESISNGNACYSLANAKYGIYPTEEDANNGTNLM